MAVHTIFKWPGGKRTILKHLIPHLPKYINHYMEPFVGGGSVFFYLLPRKAIISDGNEELINAYIQIRDNSEKLLDKLRELDVNTAEFYYKVRSWKPTNEIDRAARMIYLNKTCFNGLWRVNRKGEFNVPFGNRKNPNIVDETGIRKMSEALQETVILHGDFRDVLQYATPDSFIYLDPPYYKLTDGNFTGYTPNEFSLRDHMDLAEWCRRLDDMGCKFLYNNSAHPAIIDLFSGFNVAFIRGRTSIGGNGNNRYVTEEIIVTNY